MKSHIKQIYDDYIWDKNKGEEDIEKIEAAFFSCLLNYSEIPISKEVMEKCGFEESKFKMLTGSLLRYNKDKNTWETIHPVWDVEFLSYRYNELPTKLSPEVASKLQPAEEIVRKIMERIRDSKLIFKVIIGMCSAVAYKKELLGLFEHSIIPPTYLEDKKRAYIYYNIGDMYYELGEGEKSINAINMGIEIFEKIAATNDEFKKELAIGYHNRGVFYWTKKEEYNLAIREFTKAIEINPRYNLAYFNRGTIYSILGDLEKDEDKKKIFYDLKNQDHNKAIEISPILSNRKMSTVEVLKDMKNEDLKKLKTKRS